ncbi:MAG: hypothetical protein M3P49_15360 [Actinomycetota bacterium]|nr:hypothetical protein [Actinomycetota bacterium]
MPRVPRPVRPGGVGLEQNGMLYDRSYIEGLPRDHPHRANQNVFAFGMGAASLEVLQLLSMVVAPSGSANPGAQNHHFVTGRLDTETGGYRPSCPYSGDLLTAGERTPQAFGRHGLAVRKRDERAERTREPKIRVARLLDDIVTSAF